MELLLAATARRRPRKQFGRFDDPNRVSAPEDKNLAGSGAAHAHEASSNGVDDCSDVAGTHPR
jgi:hypothetical protein